MTSAGRSAGILDGGSLLRLVGIAPRREHGGYRRPAGDARAGRRLPARDPPERVGETALHQREHRLRFGVAQPAVELDHRRAPPASTIRPAYSTPENGRAAPPQLLEHRQADVARRPIEQLRGWPAQPGCTRPCRRCSDPGRPRAAACGPARRGGARHRCRSVSASTESSSPARNASITTTRPASPNAPSPSIARTAAAASPRVAQTIAPLPAASPDALTTSGSAWAST